MHAYVLDAEAREACRPGHGEVVPECFAAEQRGVAERGKGMSYVGLFGVELGQLVNLAAVTVLQAAGAVEHCAERFFGGSYHECFSFPESSLRTIRSEDSGCKWSGMRLERRGEKMA